MESSPATQPTPMATMWWHPPAWAERSDAGTKLGEPRLVGMKLALAMADQIGGEKQARRVDYVNTHGTSTPIGDVQELGAVKRVFEAAWRTRGVTNGAWEWAIL
eukprot:Skav223880  [mRNA]  locus=scaffold1226:530570:532773:- [translate_table: standard]